MNIFNPKFIFITKISKRFFMDLIYFEKFLLMKIQSLMRILEKISFNFTES